MSRDRRKRVSASYVEGAVLRVLLEDFLTYDSVEFRPGPHLNVIIGPNGTGKSTIVCALCLGLAGKPAFLGRATQLADYIKHGCSKAVIEIELVNKDGENYVIRREIMKNGPSEWSVNGRKATFKAVEETVARLHIQVGNLCQFLPQDKVADFAKMSPTELLESTEQAVGPPDMYENHQRLKSARETARKYELDVSNTNKLLEQETQKNKRLEQDIKNFEERQQFMKKISYLKMKRPWIEYSEKRKEYQEQKEKKESVQEEVTKARQQHAPLRQKLEATKKRVQQLDQQLKKKSEEIKQAAHEAANTINDISKGSEKAQEIYDHLQERQHQERERQRKVAELERHRESLLSEMASLDDASEDVAPVLDKVNQDMRRVNQRMTQQQQQGENLQRDRGHLTREITNLQGQLKKLQDISNQRLDMVRLVHRDTYNATMWLRSNGHRFKGVIHEPIMTVINMKDPRFARYVESQIPFNDMRAFVCENEDDNKLFLRIMRDEQKLKVNTVQVPQERLDSFKPREPLTKYKQYGFAYYMKDLMECPDGVMSYLCLMHRIHQIPIGTAHTKDRVEQITRNCPELLNFYTENHRYTIRKSKYNPNITSSRCTELKKPRLLTVTQDHKREKALRGDVDSKQAELTRLEEEYRNCQTVSGQLESEMNKLRQEKQTLMQKRDQRRSIHQKIQVKTQNIERLQGEHVDMGAEKQRYTQRIHENNTKISNLLEKFSGHVQQCATLGQSKVRLGMQHSSCLRSVQDMDTELRDGSHALQTLEREFERLKEHTKVLLAGAKRLLEEARNITGIQSDADFPEEMKQNFYSCPNSLEEIDAMIHENQARADCTMATDENVVNDYKRRKKEISRLNSDLDKKSNQLEQHQEDIKDIKTRWIEPLKDLISRINENFSFYFSSMKCAGEVDLSVPENPEDYEKYALRIKVKFRDTESLRELNPFHQSGGERSVATVLYMMALQELTKCPFRCVDEINQGMDPQNERKVFELVVKTVCQRNSSQYFLLTPKLLPDLAYSENMTVLCIYNGPQMIDHRHWNLEKFREIRLGFE